MGGASFHTPGPTHLMGRKVGSRGAEGHPPGNARCPPHAPSTVQALQVPIFTLPPLLWLDGAHSHGDSFWPSPRGRALCHGQDHRVTRSWCNAGVAGWGGGLDGKSPFLTLKQWKELPRKKDQLAFVRMKHF